MILTEEQRAALKRVVAYMDEMYAIASPYHGCTEDANILRAMIDSSGTVEPAEGFDLEKDRDALDEPICPAGQHRVVLELRGALAEIERLRAENEEAQESLTAAYMLGSHEKAHEQAAHISELEVEIAELKADLEQSEICIQARLDVIDQQAARIKELEADNQNLVTLNKSLMNNDWILRDNNRKYRKRAQKAEFLNKELKSKIGPDADAKPRVWQITDERKAAIWHAIKVLKENDIMEEPEEHLWDEEVTVLQAMLREAGQ